MRFVRFKVVMESSDILADLDTLFWAEKLKRDYTRACFLKGKEKLIVEIDMEFDKFVKLVENYEMEKENNKGGRNDRL